MHTAKRVILASSSTYRRQQLEQLGIGFTTVAPDIDESPAPEEPPRALALRLSQAKAQTVLKQDGDALVIGSDQAAELDGSPLAKPLTLDNAQRQLSACSGRQVIFYTGICVASRERVLTDVITTTVSFRTLSAKAISSYLQREAPLDCAGSFKCEGLGIALFNSISSSDPSALIGLPLIAVNLMLLEHGFDILA